MFLIRRPTQKIIEAFLLKQAGSGFSYSEVGATKSAPPGSYTVDHNRIRIGRGREAFERGKENIRRWQMFNLGWVDLFPRNAPIIAGTTVAPVVRHFGFWSLNACRIVYVIQEPRRFGFAYGTLREHAEKGEERFSIEWSEDDSVYYDILAFSRPRQVPVRVALPLSRMLQKRFARDSMKAMLFQ
jgi:uncharacterized protein (UPF0548 family)